MNRPSELFPGTDEAPTGAGGRWPILMERGDIISVKQAVYRAGRSDRTIRTWCKKFGIGHNSCDAAPWSISAPGLEMIIHGDIASLELLRAGQRDHPSVKRYFAHLALWFEP